MVPHPASEAPFWTIPASSFPVLKLGRIGHFRAWGPANATILSTDHKSTRPLCEGQSSCSMEAGQGREFPDVPAQRAELAA